MPKILNIDEMKQIAENSIGDLNNEIIASTDPQLLVNETIIKIATQLAFLNYISMATTSKEAIVPVFNYHFESISKDLTNIVDEKRKH